MQAKPSTWTDAIIRTSAIAGVLLSLSACAGTDIPISTPMHLGAAAFAPRGYIKFCERRPDQCGLPSPIANADRAQLERALYQQQWANIFNLTPTSIGAPSADAGPPTTLAEPTTASIAETNSSLAAATTTPVEGAPVEGASAPHEGGPADPGPAAANPTFSLQPVKTPGAVALHMTPLVWAALNGVNQSINDKIKPMSDEQAFGVSDYWTLPLSDGPRAVGNCKHYALEKRKALVDAGFSPNALSIAIVKTGWGETHAVLVVGTDQGDYVLDNLTPWIKGWQDVRYSWIERQTPGQPLRWALLADGSKARAS